MAKAKKWSVCSHGTRWRAGDEERIEISLGDFLADGEEFQVHVCEEMKALTRDRSSDVRGSGPDLSESATLATREEA